MEYVLIVELDDVCDISPHYFEKYDDALNYVSTTYDDKEYSIYKLEEPKNKHIGSSFDSFLIEELQEENKRLREALEFYANSSNYDMGRCCLHNSVEQDMGKTARKALNG